MLQSSLHIHLWDLVAPVARTFDLMSPAVASHSLKVAYLALRLSEELGYDSDDGRQLALAGALHDIGAFSLRERLDLLQFEETKPTQHAQAGYRLLRDCAAFQRVALLVEFHHVQWAHGAGRECDGRPVPLGSHLLHLADRVAVLISPAAEVLGQVSGICERIAEGRGGKFVPDFVDAFLRLAEKDYVWLDMATNSLEPPLRDALSAQSLEVELDDLRDLSKLLSRIIDFRSAFTAAHSEGVARVGTALAAQVGFSRQECVLFEIAAHLHDVGKLAVPIEILEKPGRLTAEEWDVMRTHVYHTNQILGSIDGFGVIATWGGLHQERLNGSGYPFGFTADELPLGARLMAVADVFTGITEPRPYRDGMSKREAVEVLQGMSERGELDPSLVVLALGRYEELDGIRAEAQAEALREYDAFRKDLE